MRKPLSARARRVVPVFLGVAAAHLAAGVWAELQRGALPRSAVPEAVVIPVVLAPRLPEPKPKAPQPRSHPRPGQARARLGAPAPRPLILAGDAGRLAPPIPALPAEPGLGARAQGAATPTLSTPSVSIAYPVNPGYWQVAEHWFILSKTEFYCVDPFSILRFMVEPCNHIYRCAYGVEDVEDGRIRFTGVIRGHDEKYDVIGDGAYSQTSIDVTVKASGHYKILPVAFGASLAARYISDACPAGAKRIRQR